MQVKSIAECSREHSAILLTFIKLPFVFMIFVLSFFEWPLKTGSTVHAVDVKRRHDVGQCTIAHMEYPKMVLPLQLNSSFLMY